MKFKNAFEKACNADTLPEIMHDGILTFHMTTVLDKNNDLSIDVKIYEYKNKRYLIIYKNNTAPMQNKECITFTELTNTETKTQEFIESPIIDLSNKQYGVKYNNNDYTILTLKTIEKKRTPNSDNKHISNKQPTFLEITAINKDGNICILNDEAWLFEITQLKD